jgi:hypothetical protein
VPNRASIHVRAQPAKNFARREPRTAAERRGISPTATDSARGGDGAGGRDVGVRMCR